MAELPKDITIERSAFFMFEPAAGRGKAEKKGEMVI
jgi:hypothetical protein